MSKEYECLTSSSEAMEYLTMIRFDADSSGFTHRKAIHQAEGEIACLTSHTAS